MKCVHPQGPVRGYRLPQACIQPGAQDPPHLQQQPWMWGFPEPRDGSDHLPRITLFHGVEFSAFPAPPDVICLLENEEKGKVVLIYPPPPPALPELT